MRKEWGAYLCLAGAMAVVGASVVAAKVVTSHLPVFLASALRFALASAVLVPLLLWREGRFPRVTRRQAGALFAVAASGIFVFNVCMLYGLRWTGAADAGIITSATPALIGVLSYLLLRERLRASQAAGIALTVLGLLALNLTPGGEGGSVGARGGQVPELSVAGTLLILAAAVGEALYSVIGKGLTRTLSPLAITALVTLIGFGMFVPFALYEAVGFAFGPVPPWVWLLLTAYAFFVAGASMLWYRGVTHVPANNAAIFTGVLPVSAVLLSYAVLGKTFRLGHALGMAGVLAGIACIAWPRR